MSDQETQQNHYEPVPCFNRAEGKTPPAFCYRRHTHGAFLEPASCSLVQAGGAATGERGVTVHVGCQDYWIKFSPVFSARLPARSRSQHVSWASEPYSTAVTSTSMDETSRSPRCSGECVLAMGAIVTTESTQPHPGESGASWFSTHVDIRQLPNADWPSSGIGSLAHHHQAAGSTL